MRSSQGDTMSTVYVELMVYPELGGINREVGLTFPWWI